MGRRRHPERPQPLPVTKDVALENIRVSPDGRFVTFGSNRTGGQEPRSSGYYDIWQKRADGSGEARLVLEKEGGGVALRSRPVWSGDGRWLVYAWGRARSPGDIFGYQPGGDAPPVPLVATESDEQFPVVSHDGRWLAYASNQSGRFEVYVRPFPNVGDAQWKVSTGGGRDPSFAHNGRELLFVNGRDQLAVAEYTTDPGFRVLGERVLFSIVPFAFLGNWPGYAIANDDGRFLMLRLVREDFAEVSLIFNFFEELKRSAPN